MSALPTTPVSLLTQLRENAGNAAWQNSWRRFLELYHEPIGVVARAIFAKHTGKTAVPESFVEDITAGVVADFFKKDFAEYDRAKGRLRTYLRFLINARVVDFLRKENFLSDKNTDEINDRLFTPPETPAEAAAFEGTLAAALAEDLRGQIPHRQFEIFEMVKLKNISPEQVAAEFGVTRSVVDNDVYKAMTKLREIAQRPEYRDEYYAK